MAQRLKGQEVTVGFTSPEGDQPDFAVVNNFEFEIDIEILEEMYLGEVGKRYDDHFNGYSGKIEGHIETNEWFKFSERVEKRAQRRTPAAGVFTATTSFNMPNGGRVRVTFEDIFFGALPFRAPGQAEYVALEVTWKCSTLRRVL
jgi:hypothetical protein